MLGGYKMLPDQHGGLLLENRKQDSRGGTAET